MKQKPQQRITFRVPKPLLEWLKAEAKKEERSMNGQLIKLVEQAKKEQAEQPIGI